MDQPLSSAWSLNIQVFLRLPYKLQWLWHQSVSQIYHITIPWALFIVFWHFSFCLVSKHILTPSSLHFQSLVTMPWGCLCLVLDLNFSFQRCFLFPKVFFKLILCLMFLFSIWCQYEGVVYTWPWLFIRASLSAKPLQPTNQPTNQPNHPPLHQPYSVNPTKQGGDIWQTNESFEK